MQMNCYALRLALGIMICVLTIKECGSKIIQNLVKNSAVRMSARDALNH
jgi:hypothetical protein